MIVEDEPLIAMDLELAVRDQQGIVVGIGRSLAEARQLMGEPLDGVILDLQLSDGVATSLAETLIEKRVPFVIHSGQAGITVPSAWSVPIVEKPALPEHVVTILAAQLQA